MLILTRRPSESIIIGDDIVITCLSMRGNQVKLGIDAPKYISVHRKEIKIQIDAEKKIQMEGEVEDEMYL